MSTVELVPDISQGRAVNVQVQMSATPGTVKTLTNIPSWVKYVKIYAQSGNVAFAFNEDPAIDAADAGTTEAINVTTNGSVGDIAVSGWWEVSIPANVVTLRLASDTASAKVWVSFRAGPARA